MAATEDAIRVEDTAKRIRVLFGGAYLADTISAKLVWERASYPTYYIPAGDVRTDLLAPSGRTEHTAGLGDAAVHDVTVGDATAPGAARWYTESTVPGLNGTVRFDWGAMDAWFEEEEQVHVHPRDPYTRIDVLQSSRHVRVEVDGVTVADSHQPRLLFETGLPTRYYLPKTDVRMDLLRPADRVTHCPYKGSADYYALIVAGATYDDAVWWYRNPLRESIQIAGYVCFYNERVDLYVDGARQQRPVTPFS